MTTETYSLSCIIFLVLSGSLMCSSVDATRNFEQGKHASVPKVNSGFRVELSHVDSKGNFTRLELIRRAAARTMHRLSQLSNTRLYSSTNISSTVQSTSGEYIMDLAIGNTPVPYSAIVDTGSDLVWTRCTPSTQCASQPTTYNPSCSTTVSSVPYGSPFYRVMCSQYNPRPMCFSSYNYTYGSGWTSGTLDKETFTFGNTKSVQVSNIVFGCSTSTSDSLSDTSGLVGLGRGILSLTSQLNAGAFSYCLTSFLDTSSTSPLFVGPLATFSASGVESTPFVKNPSMSPMSTYYYLSLQGISLGTNNLPIDPAVFALQSDGTGGVIIDSGTTITALVAEAYRAVRNGVRSIVKLQRADGSRIGFDLCYYLPTGTSRPTMPNMTFHFEDADMALPVDNYMLADEDLWCLAMFGSDELPFSIFGHYQQQNFHILYDVSKGVLSFVQAQCDNL